MGLSIKPGIIYANLTPILQLEAQACDRIYRVGQKREVFIHR